MLPPLVGDVSSLASVASAPMGTAASDGLGTGSASVPGEVAREKAAVESLLPQQHREESTGEASADAVAPSKETTPRYLHKMQPCSRYGCLCTCCTMSTDIRT